MSSRRKPQARISTRASIARVSNRPFGLMIAMRAIYLAAILFFLATGRWHMALFNGIIFAGSLFVPYLGRRERQFYTFDFFVMLTFGLALIPSYFGLWPDLRPIGELYGFDKVFHMAGGACLAMFAAILVRNEVKKQWLFYSGIIIFALAIGAAWELFEWIFSILPPPFYASSSGYADSMLDLVADTIGALVVAIILKLRRYL